ncbi:MAG: Spy/CpxP family protein refolding chaperone [Hyphomicrobiales bacterium]|nr:Spy/CpxP family protein refolding chaperone [Hyphomicrobiales bacterium]
MSFKRLAIVAATGLTLFGAAAYAQTPAAPGPGDRPRAEQRMDRMERRASRMEERMNRRVEALKSELKLTPAQEALWAPVQAQLGKMQQERRAFRESSGQRFRSAELPDRLDMMSERAARGATNMRELSAAMKPLWATLDSSQKDIVRRAMPGGRGRDRG